LATGGRVRIGFCVELTKREKDDALVLLRRGMNRVWAHGELVSCWHGRDDIWVLGLSFRFRNHVWSAGEYSIWWRKRRTNRK
jgi:hypothetical protein